MAFLIHPRADAPAYKAGYRDGFTGRKFALPGAADATRLGAGVTPVTDAVRHDYGDGYEDGANRARYDEGQVR